jgi:GTPase SAR1 and related small G proteins
MNLTYYIGLPGTGKTTLMRSILSDLRDKETDEFVKEGFVTYHKFPKQKTIVLGRYDEGTFAGTDTWAKSAGPKFSTVALRQPRRVQRLAIIRRR